MCDRSSIRRDALSLKLYATKNLFGFKTTETRKAMKRPLQGKVGLKYQVFKFAVKLHLGLGEFLGTVRQTTRLQACSASWWWRTRASTLEIPRWRRSWSWWWRHEKSAARRRFCQCWSSGFRSSCTWRPSTWAGDPVRWGQVGSAATCWQCCGLWRYSEWPGKLFQRCRRRQSSCRSHLQAACTWSSQCHHRYLDLSSWWPKKARQTSRNKFSRKKFPWRAFGELYALQCKRWVTFPGIWPC